MAFFSIIVPVYNVAPYLSQCVDSILHQTFPDFELILVDDGSTDHSGTICDRYAASDRRIRVIHKANGGLSSARNCGMEVACGEYILFLDSDDYWDDADALNLIRWETISTGADIVLLKHRKLDTNTGHIESCTDSCTTSDIVHLSYAEQFQFCVERQLFDTCAWNKAFRRSLTDTANLSFAEGVIAEDLDWAARLSLAANRLAIVATPVHIYRKGRPGSITASLQLKNLIDTKAGIENCLHYVEDRQPEDSFLYGYYSYVSYRYVIWMAESAVVQDPSKKRLIQEMKQYCWLLEYRANHKVRLAAVLTRFVGYAAASGLLGFYLNFKR